MLAILLLACQPPIDTSPPPDTDPDTDVIDTGPVELPAPVVAERVVKTCAPNDGAAIKLELGLAADACDATWGTGTAILTVEIYGDIAWKTPGKFTFADTNGRIEYATSKEARKELAFEGWLEITSWDAIGADGTYEFSFPGGHLSGTFDDAIACDPGTTCG
jgi:hypothetical protein